jgi:flagellar motility protein MotE (MotC chaperone)
MMQINKLIFFLAIIFFFSVIGSQLLFRDNTGRSWMPASVHAEDEKPEKQENSEKAKDEKAAGDSEEPCPECPECPDPAKVVLRGLEDKKTAIDKQQKILDKQRKDLAVFEEQIDEKINQLTKLQEQIKSDLAILNQKKSEKEQQQEAQYEAKVGKLVKIYAAMKPKDAAQKINELNLEVAQEIFLRMREASASQILAFVDNEKAAKISERLAFKIK